MATWIATESDADWDLPYRGPARGRKVVWLVGVPLLILVLGATGFAISNGNIHMDQALNTMNSDLFGRQAAPTPGLPAVVHATVTPTPVQATASPTPTTAPTASPRNKNPKGRPSQTP